MAPGSFALACSVYASSPSTLWPDPAALSPSRVSGWLVLPRVPSTKPFGVASRTRGRCILTDLCNQPETRAPVGAFESRAVRLAPIETLLQAPPRLAFRRRGGTHPVVERRSPFECLAALSDSRPLVSARLTARAQLRLARARYLVARIRERGRALPRRAMPLHRGVVDHVQSCRAASDDPCRARCARRLGGRPHFTLRRGPHSPRARQSAEIVRPGASSVDECSRRETAFAASLTQSFYRSDREPATGPATSPPRPGFRRLFAPRSALAPRS